MSSKRSVPVSVKKLERMMERLDAKVAVRIKQTSEGWRCTMSTFLHGERFAGEGFGSRKLDAQTEAANDLLGKLKERGYAARAIIRSLEVNRFDYSSALNEVCDLLDLAKPVYEEVSGERENYVYKLSMTLPDGDLITEGTGFSKPDGRRMAAGEALKAQGLISRVQKRRRRDADFKPIQFPQGEKYRAAS